LHHIFATPLPAGNPLGWHANRGILANSSQVSTCAEWSDMLILQAQRTERDGDRHAGDTHVGQSLSGSLATPPAADYPTHWLSSIKLSFMQIFLTALTKSKRAFQEAGPIVSGINYFGAPKKNFHTICIKRQKRWHDFFCSAGLANGNLQNFLGQPERNC